MTLFAYASNMNVDALAADVPSARKLAVGCLHGYSFVFNRTGADLSAKANIITCDELNAAVWGVLIEIADAERDSFFHADGTIELMPVTCEDAEGKTYEAEAFVSLPHATNDYLLPYDWYQEKIVTFARRQGLPDDYTHKLEIMTSKPDPDDERKARRLKKFK